MRKNAIRRSFIVNLVLIVGIVLLAAITMYLTSFANEKTERHTIMSVDKVENHISWNEDLFDVLRGFFDKYSQLNIPHSSSSAGNPIPIRGIQGTC